MNTSPDKIREMADAIDYAGDPLSAEYLKEVATHVEQLEAALEPFVRALEKTIAAYGFDITKTHKTCNMVSTPYILMEDYAAARNALRGKPNGT